MCGGGMCLRKQKCLYEHYIFMPEEFSMFLITYLQFTRSWPWSSCCCCRYFSKCVYVHTNNLIITRLGKYKARHFLCGLDSIACLCFIRFHFFDSEHAPERSGSTVDANECFYTQAVSWLVVKKKTSGKKKNPTDIVLGW